MPKRARSSHKGNARLAKGGVFYDSNQIVKQLDLIGGSATSAHNFNFNLVSTAYNATPSAGYGGILLNPIQEGVGFYNRIGRTVCMKSLHMDLYWNQTVQPLNSAVQHILRVFVVYDEQANGAVFTFPDLCKSYQPDGTALSYPMAQLNPDNKDRFKVLYDKSILLPTSEADRTVSEQGCMVVQSEKLHQRINLQLKGLVTKFNTTANPLTIANIQTGSLYLITVIEGDATSSWNCLGSCRLRFVD